MEGVITKIIERIVQHQDPVTPDLLVVTGSGGYKLLEDHIQQLNDIKVHLVNFGGFGRIDRRLMPGEHHLRSSYDFKVMTTIYYEHGQKLVIKDEFNLEEYLTSTEPPS